MNKVIAAIVALVLIAGAFFIGTKVGSDDTDKESKKEASETTSTMKKEDASDTTGAMNTTETTQAMMTEKLELDKNLPTPTATITVEKDAKMGYNLRIETTDFTFTPQNANTDKSTKPQNEGHTHLYVNGVKVTRVYSEYYYMPADMAKAGDEVYVTLNTDKHIDIVDSNKVTLK
jgi:hypothetical protein